LPGTNTLAYFASLLVTTNKNKFCNIDNLRSVSQADDEILEEVLEFVRLEKLLGEAADPESQKVIEFVHPKDLEKCLGDLEIGSEPSSRDALKVLMERVIRYSVKTNHHRFYNQVRYNENRV